MTNDGAKMQMFFDKPVMTHSNFRMVIDLSSVLVIDECERWFPDDEKNNYPEGASILGMLNRHVRWAQHGFINAIQSHVQMIYAYQEAVINAQETKQYMLCPEYDEAKLIVKALDTYQIWKQKIVQQGYDNHGKGWGDAYDFNHMKWNKNNEKFIGFYEKKRE